MNKNAIQKFAVWARNELIGQIKQRAYQYEITEEGYGDADAAVIAGRVLSEGEKRQRSQFVDLMKRVGYQQVIEEVAYTWFNRFVALRYMEVNDYLPTHIRVFSDANGAFNPEILKDVLHLDLPDLDKAKVSELINANATDDLYRYLLLTQCNALNDALPELFERMGDHTEMLLPNNILRQEGILGRLVGDIPEEDWRDAVQIIGWMYQYYNTEPKQAVFDGLKKNVKITKEKIPAATQLFTPDWIVRYMVENSLGRLWIQGHPNKELKAEWKYYLEEAEQTPEVMAELERLRAEYRNLNPEDIKIIDPCMGSGHILVYAFDVLMQIYRSAGYADRDAAKLILEKNLYGLDIDRRAYQLAYFALMMKARQYSRRILTQNVALNLCEIIESNDLQEAYKYTLDMGDFLLGHKHRQDLDDLMDAFMDAKEYGSLMKIENRDYDALLHAWKNTAMVASENGNLILWQDAMNEFIPKYIKQAKLLSQKYDVVVTNPPYMGASGMGTKLAEFVKKSYPDSKSDLFATFIERCGAFVVLSGYQAMITQHAWMFLSSYEKLRTKLITSRDIVNMAHLGARAFEEIGGDVVQTTAFVMNARKISGFSGTFARLVAFSSQDEKEAAFLSGDQRHNAAIDNFVKIPGSPVAYWVSEAMLRAFEEPNKIGDLFFVKAGMCTGRNEVFILNWFEVCFDKCSLRTMNYSFTPHNKGGEFHRYYGNREQFLKYNDKYLEQMGHNIGFRHDGKEFYFREHIGWSKITSSKSSFRYFDDTFTFDSAGLGLFQKNANSDLLVTLGFLNSKIVEEMVALLNPTLNVTPVIVKAFPYIEILEKNNLIKAIVTQNISLSRTDWDSFETSWDFKRHPLI